MLSHSCRSYYSNNIFTQTQEVTHIEGHHMASTLVVTLDKTSTCSIATFDTSNNHKHQWGLQGGGDQRSLLMQYYTIVTATVRQKMCCTTH